MAVLRPIMIRNFAFAVGLGVAAITIAGTAGDDGPANQVAGSALSAKQGDQQLAATTAGSEPDAPAKMVGDVDLAGALDLTKMERVDDHYEVPLSDGRRAILTLDPQLQKQAEKVLKQSRSPRGAVVLTALDGRILAYAARRVETVGGEKTAISDPSLASTVWAPAASIFKIATAAALVDAGVSASTEVCYHGGVRSVMEENLEDHKADNRCNDLEYGIAHSQNAVIAKLVHKHLEPSQLRATAASLGFAGDLPAWALGGQSGSVDVPAEKGVDFAKTAAGFRGSELSPLGGALLAGTFATGGLRPTPTIVAAVVDGKRRIAVSPPEPTRILDAKVADEVGDMMVETCDRGSAAKVMRAKDGLPRSVKIAGKTGTLARAEPGAAEGAPELEYSWFVGYAPADRPAFTVSVVLGNTDLWWLKGHMAAKIMVRAALDELDPE